MLVYVSVRCGLRLGWFFGQIESIDSTKLFFGFGWVWAVRKMCVEGIGLLSLSALSQCSSEYCDSPLNSRQRRAVSPGACLPLGSAFSLK